MVFGGFNDLFSGIGASTPTEPAGMRFARDTGIGAFMDRYISGVPTREEAVFNRQNDLLREQQLQEEARKQQMRGIMERVQQLKAADPNMPPHTIMSQILQDPKFVDAFVSIGPDQFNSMITDLVKATQPPKPEQFTLSAGQGRFDETGRQIAAQPTGDVQNQSYLLSLSPEQRAMLAETTNALDQGRTTQAERSVSRMLEMGWIDQNTAEGILSGALKVVTERDAAGNPVRQVLVDLRNNSVTALGTSNGEPARPGQGKVPGQPDAPVDKGELPSARISQLEDPASMFDVVGIVPKLTGTLGGIAGQFAPELATPEIDAKKGAIDRYATAVLELNGHPRLRSVANEMTKLLPDRSGLSNPQAELVKAIGMRELLENRLSRFQDELMDDSIPTNTKKDISDAAAKIRDTLETMPTLEQMQRRLQKHKSGQIPLGLGELKDKTSKAVGAAGEAVATGGASLEKPAGQGGFNNWTEAQIKQLTRDQIRALSEQDRAALLARIEQLKKGRK